MICVPAGGDASILRPALVGEPIALSPSRAAAGLEAGVGRSGLARSVVRLAASLPEAEWRRRARPTEPHRKVLPGDELLAGNGGVES